ncbi:MAG: hypothetical protein ABEJ28_08630 [Salinigranum sp.]
MTEDRHRSDATKWTTSKRAFLRTVGAGALAAGALSTDVSARRHRRGDGSGGAVDLSTDCRGDVGVLVATNTTDRAVRVVVDGPDGLDVIGESLALDPNSEIRLTGLPDGEYLVRTLTRGGDQTDWRVLSVACRLQGVAVGTDCEDGEGVITAENPNDEAVLVDVDGPDGEDEVGGLARIDPDESKSFDGLSDGEYLVRTLTGDQEQIGWEVVTVDC